IAGRFFDIGCLIDHHRRVPRSDAVRRLTRTICRLHYGRPAGGDRQIADRHQLLRERMLGVSAPWRTSSGAPAAFNAARMMRTTSAVVLLLAGCGEKITASLHLTA